MSMTTATRRNAGINQEYGWTPRGNLGGLIDSTEKDMQRLTGGSAADCDSSLKCSLANNPTGTLRTVTRVLHLMNVRDIEKKSHRQALVRAGKKALAMIGEYQGDRP